jgi:hypothetical protein
MSSIVLEVAFQRNWNGTIIYDITLNLLSLQSAVEYDQEFENKFEWGLMI